MLHVANPVSAQPVPAPRVLVGEYTPLVSGPDMTPIPSAEQVPEPVYAYTHEQIDADCDAHVRWPASIACDPEERRARLHRELDRAIAGTGTEIVSLSDLLTAEQLAEDAFDAACVRSDDIELGREATDAEVDACEAANKAQAAALMRVFSHTPRSASELIAMMDLFDKREGQHLAAPHDGMISNLFCSARVFLDPDNYFGDPDPVDLLFAEWHRRALSFSADTKGMSDDESDPIFDALCNVEVSVDLATPSPMQAAAALLIELYHDVGSLNSPETPATLLAVKARNDLSRILTFSLEGLRPVLRGAIRRCVDDLFDHPDVRLVESALYCGFVPAPALLQAAE